jgi:hypothetical protein
MNFLFAVAVGLVVSGRNAAPGTRLYDGLDLLASRAALASREPAALAAYAAAATEVTQPSYFRQSCTNPKVSLSACCSTPARQPQ